MRFQGQGPIRTVYFTILITHTMLAALIVPLVLVTLVPALRGRFDRHRRLARITLPLWAYVSVTGRGDLLDAVSDVNNGVPRAARGRYVT